MVINAHNIIVGNWKKETTGKHIYRLDVITQK
jgi:hypothetical protein